MFSCGLEAEILGPITDRGHVVLPEPEDTLVSGQATLFAGGTAQLFTSGTNGPSAQATLDDTGLFTLALPGTFQANGALVWVERGQDVAMAVLPVIPRAASVFHEPLRLAIWEQHVALTDLDSATTAASMIIARAARRMGLGLDALSSQSVLDAYDTFLALRGNAEHPVAIFERVVATLASVTASGGEVRSRPEALDGEGGFLSQLWLDGVEVDYDGDGVSDPQTELFEQMLDEASKALDLGTCFAEAEILTVFHVDLRTGRLDGNCAAVDPYKHASDLPGKGVFFTGGIHEDTPVCSDSVTTECLSEGQIDAANALLGDWEPNRIPMYDDGTQGDAQANDGIWTLTLALPYIPPRGLTGDSGAPWAGVRLGYKYTFGQAGAGWTDSEEWPGNRRIIELLDLNGDRIVTRYDVFGDETSNKDFVNQRAPAKGGCSFVTWADESLEGCHTDTHENRIGVAGVSPECDGGADSEGTWDEAGPVAPLTVPCPED